MYLDGLMPHQKAGAQWLVDNPKGMLAWEMGVGKTATTLRAWENTADGPLLVLCLASARENWRREAIRFAIDPDFPPRVQVVINKNDPIDPQASIVVTNYDKLLQKQLRTALRRRWSAIALDEAHMLKTPSAQRTKIVYGGGHVRQTALIKFADRVWPLTGTPMPNHPGELWTHAYHLWPQSLIYQGKPMELWQFELGFCEMRQNDHGYSVIGGRNLGELKDRLSPYMNRLRRKQVLDLPTLRIDSWPLDMERTMGVGKWPDDPELRAKLAHYGEVDNLDNDALDAYLSCINSNQVSLATIRRETSIIKAIAGSFLVHDELANSTAQKTVIFAQHRDAIGVLTKGLSIFQPAIVHGGVPPGGKRDAEIDRFKNDPKCRVFIGQIQAAGSSINLQAADNVVFIEASWSPGENDQALSRVYRAGQQKPVLVRFAYLKGSIDEAVNRALARKAAMIAQVIN